MNATIKIKELEEIVYQMTAQLQKDRLTANNITQDEMIRRSQEILKLEELVNKRKLSVGVTGKYEQPFELQLYKGQVNKIWKLCRDEIQRTGQGKGTPISTINTIQELCGAIIRNINTSQKILEK